MRCESSSRIVPANNAPGGAALGFLALALSVLLQVQLPTQAQNKAASGSGMFVTVNTPITENSVKLIEAKIADVVRKGKLQTIVFDFNPGGERASTSDPWLGMKLKDYIRSLPKGSVRGLENVQTVAFVHGDVKGHTLLPVLACDQLVMSEGSLLGPVATGQDAPPAEVREAYVNLARPRHAEELVEQMLNGQQVTTKEAQAIKLCGEKYETREKLAKGLGLGPSSLKEDWLAGRVRLAAIIPLQSAVTKDNLESMKRRIKQAVTEGKNLIFLELDAEGGDFYAAADYRETLKAYQDRDGYPLTIIAWVPPNRSLGAATLLALGCSKIVMGENSALLDLAYLTDVSPEMKEQQRKVVIRAAEEQNIWQLAAELKKSDGALPRIDTKLAVVWDVAAFTDVNTQHELYARFNLEPSQVAVYRSDWLDRVAEFFRHPVVKLFLLLIGITGLILEVKMPGVTLPGIIAAICFVLFFWSHSFINEFFMLAVLLFVLGIILLALEIFVLPGFGITGICGLLLIVVSVVLVTLEKMPSTPQDWQGLGWSLGSLCVSAIGAIGLAVAIVSFLPQIPYANRLMLAPPEEDAEAASAVSALAGLLGVIGIAETPLRPAGKARFGDDYLDVISEGDYIMPGSRVQVIEIEGNRIVVKQV